MSMCVEFHQVCWKSQCQLGLNFRHPSHLAGVDSDMDCGSIGLFSLHTLNVDDILLPVDLHYFADLLAFVVSTDDLLSTLQQSQANAQTPVLLGQV